MTQQVRKQINWFFLQITVTWFCSGKSHTVPSFSVILTLQPLSVLPLDHPLFLLLFLLAPFGRFDALPLLSSWGAEGKILPTLRKEREKRARPHFSLQAFTRNYDRDVAWSRRNTLEFKKLIHHNFKIISIPCSQFIENQQCNKLDGC